MCSLFTNKSKIDEYGVRATYVLANWQWKIF